MLQMKLAQEEQEALRYERFNYPHPRVQKKIEAVLLKSYGLPHGLVANILGIDEGTLRDYLREYQQGGIEKLKTTPWRQRFIPPGKLVNSRVQEPAGYLKRKSSLKSKSQGRRGSTFSCASLAGRFW